MRRGVEGEDEVGNDDGGIEKGRYEERKAEEGKSNKEKVVMIMRREEGVGGRGDLRI